MLDSTLNPTNPSNTNTAIELLVFDIGKLTLALPILQVQKIVKRQEVHGSGLSHVKLAHMGDGEIAVVDLHQKLFGTSHSEAEGYFIISKNTTSREPLGIAVAQSPNLINVPLDRIRQLPNSYRRADTLEIASHVTVVSQGEQTTTIFILDLERLI